MFEPANKFLEANLNHNCTKV